MPVNLLRDDWRTARDRTTPCTRCSLGPLLEFSLPVERPLNASREAACSSV